MLAAAVTGMPAKLLRPSRVSRIGTLAQPRVWSGSLALAAGRRRVRGVTLVELMVTLGVLTVVLTVGVPGFVSLAHNSQVSAISEALSMSLALARSEAIRRGAPVSVCASRDGSSCSGDWSTGWIVTVPGGGGVLRVRRLDAGHLGPTEASGETRVVFGSLGALQTAAVSWAIGDRGVAGGRLRTVKVGASGRVTLATNE